MGGGEAGRSVRWKPANCLPGRKGALGGRSRRNPRNFASGLRKLAPSNRDRPKSRQMSRPTFGASKVLKLRNFRNSKTSFDTSETLKLRNSETSKGRNFETSETRKRAKNDSGSWRIPSAAAQKGALGGRSARDPRNCASGIRKLALPKQIGRAHV